ncbi:MAG: hypothetical protein D5S00_09735 [Tindallia sp. MSAO_Bac2]|nr:MAG: hypothetical protein D5S00_09735 [Tindallia sp. MSAO_Bac2]
MNHLLSAGDKVDIEIENKNNPVDSKVLYSQVLELAEDSFYISVPMTKGFEYPLRTNQKLNIIFFNDKGVYTFRGECRGKVKIENLDAYEIVRLSEPKKKQRREFFRLKYMIKVSLKSLEKDTIANALTLDLSGGGLKVLTDRSFYVGEKIEATLFLEEGDVTVASVVVRAHKRSEDKRFELGIKFHDIGEQNRNKIVAFIFQKQGELRKKGLI